MFEHQVETGNTGGFEELYQPCSLFGCTHVGDPAGGDQGCHPIRDTFGYRGGHMGAARITPERDAQHPDRVDHRFHVRGVLFEAICRFTGRLAGEAVTASVNEHASEPVEPFHVAGVLPHRAIPRRPVQEHNRRPLANRLETDAHASALDEPHRTFWSRSHYGEPDGCESSTFNRHTATKSRLAGNGIDHAESLLRHLLRGLGHEPLHELGAAPVLPETEKEEVPVEPSFSVPGSARGDRPLSLDQQRLVVRLP